MLESAVGDGSQEFSLEQEISETSGMDADIGTFGLVCATAADCKVTFLRGAIGRSCRCFSRLKFLVGVIDEIFFGRHSECGVNGLG